MPLARLPCKICNKRIPNNCPREVCYECYSVSAHKDEAMLSIKSKRLAHLHKLEKFNLPNDESVEAMVKAKIECNNLIKIREYMDLIFKK